MNCGRQKYALRWSCMFAYVHERTNVHVLSLEAYKQFYVQTWSNCNAYLNKRHHLKLLPCVPESSARLHPHSPIDERSCWLLALAFEHRPANLICCQNSSLWLPKRNTVTRHQWQASLSMASTSVVHVKNMDSRKPGAAKTELCICRESRTNRENERESSDCIWHAESWYFAILGDLEGVESEDASFQPPAHTSLFNVCLGHLHSASKRY